MSNPADEVTPEPLDPKVHAGVRRRLFPAPDWLAEAVARKQLERAALERQRRTDLVDGSTRLADLGTPDHADD